MRVGIFLFLWIWVLPGWAQADSIAVSFERMKEAETDLSLIHISEPTRL